MPEVTKLAAGERLGPYEILAPVGSGGMGEVWKARDTRLGRIVAIKRLKGNHGARFEQEARAIAALNHPHICQIYDVGPDYLVMEYIDGAPLRGGLQVEEALRLAIQIAGALEAAHRKNIIHRDLKPGNIMVTEGTVKLLDFGLAKLVTGADADVTATMEGMVAGTAAYMSPEQAQGKPLDPRSDIFSFGAVLYEMFSGRRAFQGEQAVTALGAVIHKDPEPLNVSPEIVRIVTRCLRKAPSERFQSVAEIKAALEQMAAKPAEQQPSIAVLPFANMSGDKEQEYFSDGLAEEIINALAQLPGLKVTARTSAFAFRGKEQDIRNIAEALDVRTVLEGSVRRSGNRIRVTAQLINAADGYHLWSQRYDREMADIFDVQDEIAAAIAGALEVRLAPKNSIERYKPSLPAYEALLKGRHEQWKVTPRSWQVAKECYEQAIAQDPKFALPYAELAGLFNQTVALGMRPPQEIVPLMRAYAEKALELDPSLPDAHMHLGMAAGIFDFDWKEARRRIDLVLAQQAVSPMCRLLYMSYLWAQRRPLEAVDQIRRAVEEDPLSVIFRSHLALSLWTAGRDGEALQEANRALELDDNHPLPNAVSAYYHCGQGAYREALPFAEKAHLLMPHYQQATGILAGLLVRTGDGERAQSILSMLGPPTAFGVPRGLALFHLIAGEIDKAADWFERTIEQRDGLLASGSAWPVFRPLRESPRWPKLAKMMNLPA